MTVLAYGPGLLGITGVSVSALWFVSRVVASPYSTAGLGESLFVFVGVLAASLATLLVGVVLIGGSHT